MKWISVLLFVLLLCVNCTVMSLKGSGINNPVSLTPQLNREYEVIRPNATWRKEVSAEQVKDFDIRLAILDLLAETPGDAIVNLRFKIYQTFMQGCIQTCLLDLYVPYTIEIQADIVRYKK